MNWMLIGLFIKYTCNWRRRQNRFSVPMSTWRDISREYQDDSEHPLIIESLLLILCDKFPHKENKLCVGWVGGIKNFLIAISGCSLSNRQSLCCFHHMKDAEWGMGYLTIGDRLKRIAPQPILTRLHWWNIVFGFNQTFPDELLELSLLFGKLCFSHSVCTHDTHYSFYWIVRSPFSHGFTVHASLKFSSHADLIPERFLPFQLHLYVCVGRFITLIEYQIIVLDNLLWFKGKDRTLIFKLNTTHLHKLLSGGLRPNPSFHRVGLMCSHFWLTDSAYLSPKSSQYCHWLCRLCAWRYGVFSLLISNRHLQQRM